MTYLFTSMEGNKYCVNLRNVLNFKMLDHSIICVLTYDVCLDYEEA